MAKNTKNKQTLDTEKTSLEIMEDEIIEILAEIIAQNCLNPKPKPNAESEATRGTEIKSRT